KPEGVMGKREDGKKIIYYKDELNDEFSEAVINAKTIDEDYDYVGGFGRSLGRFFLYKCFARPFAFIYLKLAFGHKIVGKRKLKAVKKGGYFIYANHTNPVPDAFIPSMVAFPKSVAVIVHPANVSMPVLGKITPCLGALPLPDTIGAAKNFSKAISHFYKKNFAIMIYPEAHIWPYYTKIRPFNEKSFGYPVSENAPVFCFTNTYQKRRFFKNPRMVTYINGPFYPKEEGTLRDKKLTLRNDVYNAMCAETVHNEVEKITYIKGE
nr:hypothetical protein [Lachnospiraceae bacterium]